jgi:predicted secreted acid phosphatase
MYNKFLSIVLIATSFMVHSADMVPYQRPASPSAGAKLQHLNTLKQCKDADSYQSGIQRLIQYYENGEYINEVKKICADALMVFKDLNNIENSAIVFDIDETAMTEYFFYKGKNFDWDRSQMFEIRQKGESKAIPGVLNLYKELKILGYKIIFITARRESLNKITRDNLFAVGYEDAVVKDGDYVICLPNDLHGKKDLDDKPLDIKWKAAMRRVFSEKYNIVGSISDSEKDFEGGFAGHRVKLPNFLY